MRAIIREKISHVVPPLATKLAMGLIAFCLQSLCRVHPSVLRTAHTMAVTMLVLGLNLGTGVITARLLGPDGRGAQAAIGVWVWPILMLFSCGLPTASIYFMRTSKEELNVTCTSIYILAVVLGIIAVPSGVLSMPFLVGNFGPEIVSSAQLLMIFLPFSMLYMILLSVIRAHDDFAGFNLFRIIQPALTLLMLLGLVAGERLTPLTAAATYSLSGALLLPWLLPRTWRYAKPKLAGAWVRIWAQMKRLMHYGLRAHGIESVKVFGNIIDSVIVIGMLPAEAVGYYTVAKSVAQSLQQTGGAISLVILPNIAEKQLQTAIELSMVAGRFAFWSMLLVGGILLLLAPPLLKIVFGEEFVPAADVFRLLISAAVIQIFTETLMQAFIATGRPGSMSVLQMISLAVAIGLLFLLVPAYGAIGAAYAMFGVALFRMLGVFACFPLILKTGLPSLLIRAEDLRMLRRPSRLPLL